MRFCINNKGTIILQNLAIENLGLIVVNFRIPSLPQFSPDDCYRFILTPSAIFVDPFDSPEIPERKRGSEHIPSI